MEIELTTQNFESEVLKSDIPVLVDFWAPWCGPCNAMTPIIEELANDNQGKIKVGKVNVDENPTIAQTYQIRSIPTMKIFKNGQIVDEMIGMMPKTDIQNHLNQHI